MRVVIQRSKKSNVVVDKKIVGSIDRGLVLLVAFTDGDDFNDIKYIVNKVLNLRIFDDEDGIMNKSVIETNGSILSISQFTLYGDTKKGNRPSYVKSMKSLEASVLYDKFNEELRSSINVETGVFGAEMEVNICNDGPITIIIDSKNK